MILRNHIIFKLPSINLVNKTGTSLVITILNSQTKKKKKKKTELHYSTLSILQITKANEVVPISLYLSGIFCHGGQSQSEPTLPDPLSSGPEPDWSKSSTLSPVSTPGVTLSVSLIFSFSLILQRTRNFKEGKECNWEWWSLLLKKSIGVVRGGESEVLWEREWKPAKLSAPLGLGVNMAIFKRVGFVCNHWISYVIFGW